MEKNERTVVLTYILFHRIARLHTFSRFLEADGRRPSEATELGDQTKRSEAMLVEVNGTQSRIVWLGPEKQWSPKLRQSLIGKRNLKKISLSGTIVLPAFLECHTHLLYGGDRKEEFERRNRGDSYLQIAQAGGGIRSTVRETRKRSDPQILKDLESRLMEFAVQGVTVVEIKTGYAATIEEELRHLKILIKLRSQAMRSSSKLPQVVVTCLAAHSIPDGETEETWLSKVESKVFPLLKKESVRLDAFVEKGAFSLEPARRFFLKAKALGLDLAIHADQLSRTGASALGAEIAAKSVDHVIEASKEDFLKLAKSSTVAVLLPAADLYTRLPYPNARAMLDAGVRVALATDHNPGSSPGLDLALVGVLSRTAMQMTIPEVLCAYTYNAAKALGLERTHGHLTVGSEANFICLKPNADLSDLFYEVGPRRSHSAIASVWRRGRAIYS